MAVASRRGLSDKEGRGYRQVPITRAENKAREAVHSYEYIDCPCGPLKIKTKITRHIDNCFVDWLNQHLSSFAMHFTLATTAAVLAATGALASPTGNQLARRAGHNDFSCKSSSHPNPVVLLHGLGATYYEDLNFLEAFLQTQGFCTFSLTYGAYDGFPLVGGLKYINESAPQVADFVKEVHTKTGASKVDLVGHSEGAFQTLYNVKYGGIASFVGHAVAIAPPTHGTSFAGLYQIAQTLGIDNGVDTILDKFGCGACTDLVTGGPAVAKLNEGPIAQQGVKYTIIASKLDELVTPTTTAFVQEAGVNNIYVQDYCPIDPVGHIGEAYDLNVWHLVLNSLQDQIGNRFLCVLGSPGK